MLKCLRFSVLSGMAAGATGGVSDYFWPKEFAGTIHLTLYIYTIFCTEIRNSRGRAVSAYGRGSVYAKVSGERE
jgi:hypothetical protein